MNQGFSRHMMKTVIHLADFIPHEQAGRLKPPRPLEQSTFVSSVRHKTPTSRIEQKR